MATLFLFPFMSHFEERGLRHKKCLKVGRNKTKKKFHQNKNITCAPENPELISPE